MEVLTGVYMRYVYIDRPSDPLSGTRRRRGAATVNESDTAENTDYRGASWGQGSGAGDEAEVSKHIHRLAFSQRD